MRTTMLCVGRNEKDLAVRKFLPETRGYRVQLATAEREVLIGSQQGCYEDVKLLIVKLMSSAMHHCGACKVPSLTRSRSCWKRKRLRQ